MDHGYRNKKSADPSELWSQLVKCHCQRRAEPIAELLLLVLLLFYPM
jgi:hypothetical protein